VSCRLVFGVLLMCLTAAVRAGELVAQDAWLRAMPPGPSMTAVYLTLHNTGDEAVVVIGGHTALAQRLEFHESRQVEGQWRMRQLERLEVAAGGQLELRPGAIHIMLFGVARAPRAGESVPLTLQLSDGSEVKLTAQVRAPDGA
jgi:copper(I)-binding protein